MNKNRITEHLQTYVNRFESQNKAANSLKNVSAATINHMINFKWDLIKEEMWRNVAAQIDYKEDEWVIVETKNLKAFKHFLNDAQTHSLVMAITNDAGTGKTETIKQYCNATKRAYFIQCSEYFNRKYFLQELLAALGVDSGGFTVAEMMQRAVMTLKTQDKPLLVLDEADKLSDQVLHFFITLYNSLEDRCGIILCATNFLDKRLQKGVRNNKKGYKEINSRLGRKCINLPPVTTTDITHICIANGVDDKKTIKSIVEESQGDIRRVKRKIFALKMIQKNEKSHNHEATV